jgi:hypothetical protein
MDLFSHSYVEKVDQERERKLVVVYDLESNKLVNMSWFVWIWPSFPDLVMLLTRVNHEILDNRYLYPTFFLLVHISIKLDTNQVGYSFSN